MCKPSLFRQNSSESMLDLIHTGMLLLTIHQLCPSAVTPCSHRRHSHREHAMPPPVGHYNASKATSGAELSLMTGLRVYYLLE